MDLALKWGAEEAATEDEKPTVTPSRRKQVYPVDVTTVVGKILKGTKASEDRSINAFFKRYFTQEFTPYFTQEFNLLQQSHHDAGFRMYDVVSERAREAIFAYSVAATARSSGNYSDSLDAVKRAINDAFEHPEPLVAARNIAKIWEQIETTTANAEAKIRMLLARIEPPPSRPLPDWAKAGLDQVRSVDTAPAVRAAEACICAALAVNENAVAEIAKAPLGGIEIEWQVARGSLQWLVEVARIPLPGVAVRAFRRVPRSAMTARSIHLLHDLTTHFSESQELFGG